MTCVVVGGGLAGASAAALLARAGHAVTVLERDAGPADKICGEFLSIEAQHSLAALGVDAAELGGHPITHVRLVRGGQIATTALPFTGLGLSRRALDAALLDAAAAAGARVLRGTAALSVERGAVRVAGGDLPAEAVFLASGKHDLRGARRRLAAAPEEMIGFKTYLSLTPAQTAALAGHVEIMLFPDCYVGLQLVEGGRANLCLLADRTRLVASGGTWEGLLAGLCLDSTHLDRRLDGAATLLDRPLAIYRVPYGFVHHAHPDDSPDVYRLGDQAGVIPSFCGDGMAIALHSATVAARAYLAGADAGVYHRRIVRDIGGQIGRAAALQRLGRWRGGQSALMAAARLWPASLRLMASLTRIPQAARMSGRD